MLKRFAKGLLVVAAIAGMGVAIEAATSDSQTFNVTVPSSLSISAPGALVTGTLPVSDNQYALPTQTWTALANDTDGATVTFTTNNWFEHTTDSTYKRNAILDLAINSSDASAGWAVDTANDATDYQAAVPDAVATVQASSNNPGDATFNLTVTFDTVDFSTLAEGTYTTQVTGTIVGN